MIRFSTFCAILLLCILPVYSVSVEIDTKVEFDYTHYTYKFSFNQNESFKSFSFEKPDDAKLELAVDNSNYAIKYSQSGDYFVFLPENTANKNFEIKIISRETSESILAQNLFISYQNFNFPVSELTFNFELVDYLGNVSEIYPRNYIMPQDNKIVWNLSNLEGDSIFLVNFNSVEVISKNQNSVALKLLSLSIIFLLFAIIFIIFSIRQRSKFKSKHSKEAQKSDSTTPKKQVSLDSNNLEGDSENESQNHIDENKFEEITSKFLTENEKEVVSVIKENEGISQYDILNFLPSLTKSNLSKIISKLNARKILKRIKVGKVNKIYLGEKLEKNSSKSTEEI